MKDRAEIVIVGGGAIGCSIAFHLARKGKEVLLLEKAQLTHGCTWHAAGLVGQLRGKRNLTRMMQKSVALYDEIEKLTGQAVDWHKVGSLRVASSQERWTEIKRTATTARSFGFDLHLLSPKEAQDLFPLMALDDVVGAAFVPSDGYVDPYALTQAYAAGARKAGATLIEGVTVTGFGKSDRRITRVETDQGSVSCDLVVNAAGLWARDLGKLAGVAIPAGVVEHQYIVTEKIAEVTPGLPTFRDPDKLFYLKPEAGALAIGGWEPDTLSFGTGGIPNSFGRELFPSNFDRFEQIAAKIAERLPVMERAGIRTLINGPIPVSADGEPVIGPSPDLDNLFIACGFTAGIAASGGAGAVIADWIVEGDPGMDLWAFDVRRFNRHHAGSRYLAERTVEAYGGYYLLHYPGEEAHSARGGRRSPLHGRLKDLGAVFGSKSGWERPNWFALAGEEAVDRPSFDQPNWFAAVAREHRAVREGVGLIDESSFSKFEVSGPGAAAFMQHLAANDVGKPAGSIVYTQFLNHKGGIESDLTVTRLKDDLFYVVTGSGMAVRDGAWLRDHMPKDGSVHLQEVTSARAVINICGPKARTVLQRVTPDDLSNAGFPFMTAREIEIGLARVRAMRMTYFGELGWELHIPSEYAAHVYDLLWQAGQDQGIANVGYRAIDTLRMEKRYLYWGSDINQDYTPLEAGLGFAVAFDKGDFIGKAALVKQRAQGVTQKLCVFTLDQPLPLYGSEAVLSGGKVVGVTASANFGHSIGKWIATAYLKVEDIHNGPYEIEAFCERVAATRHDKPLYDAKREKLS